MNGLRIQNYPGGAAGIGRPQHRPQAPKSESRFADVFQRKLSLENGVTFSAHAMERLQSRNISMSAYDMERLNDAVTRAAEKGSRDSLVLMNDSAFVVSIKNRTVITAMSGDQMRENVVTNIDSTVLA